MTIQMKTVLDRIDLSRGRKYAAIADGIAAAITEGSIPAGEKLPPQRDLAWRLNCTVGTITRAYGELERRGLATGEIGRGTFVAPPDGVRAERAGFDAAWHISATDPLLSGRPDDAAIDRADEMPVMFRHDYPPSGAEVEEAIRTMDGLRDPALLAEMLAYQPHAGVMRHRAVGASWLSRRGIDIGPDALVVTSGAHNGVLSALAAVTGNGDTVAVEELTYPGIKAIAEMLGLRLVPVAMDEDGLDPDALDAVCRAQRVRALYCIPTLQNPTNRIMSADRRAAIAAVAMRHGLTVVEDDVFGMLPGEDPPALFTFLEEGLGIYINSISKQLSPGLRVGYVAANGATAGKVAGAVRSCSWMASPFTAEIATQWIETGAADRIIASHNEEIRARKAIVAEVLADLDIVCPVGALHAWITLPPGLRAAEVVQAAQSRGVILPPSEAFVIGETRTPRALRLSFCPPRHRETVRHGLEIVRDILAGHGTGDLMSVF